MINKMRLVFVTVTTLCLLPGLVFADGKFSLRLQGGRTYISGGDVHHGTKALFYPGPGEVLQVGEYRGVHWGYEFGGDIIFELTPRLGIGVGVGYMLSSHTSEVESLDLESGADIVVRAEPKLSAVPIRLGLYLTVPISRKFNLYADAGASYYFRARYSDEWGWGWLDYLGTQIGYIQVTTRAERKKVPLGFQGGIGFEYKLSHNLYLCLDARGRYARFRGWKGSSVLESDYEMPFSEQGTLYYESVPMLTGSPRLLMVQSAPPDGPDGEPRQAVIDFSGVSLQVGIRIRL